jgi:hypothetical protein
MIVKGNLTQLLNVRYQREGYTLTESEDFVELFYKGKNVAVFSSHGLQDIKKIEAEIERVSAKLCEF